MTKIKYRNATVADIPGMLELWRLFWRPQPYEANLRRKVQDDPDLAIVAEANHTIVGTVIGGFDGWWAWVYRIAVHPQYQRKDIASRLLLIVQERLASRGADAACAIVSPDNQAVGGLLTKLRYRKRPYVMWAVPLDGGSDIQCRTPSREPRGACVVPQRREMKNIIYKTSKRVSAAAVLALFRRNEWREWFTLRDTEDLLRRALFVASAWRGRRAVGVATLFGDGRFYAHIDTVLVDEAFRRQGIGTALVELLMRKVDQLKPHYCEHDTHHEWLVAFYKRFRFEVNESDNPWLVHRPTEDRLGAYVKRRRAILKRQTNRRPSGRGDAEDRVPHP